MLARLASLAHHPSNQTKYSFRKGEMGSSGSTKMQTWMIHIRLSKLLKIPQSNLPKGIRGLYLW